MTWVENPALWIHFSEQKQGNRFMIYDPVFEISLLNGERMESEWWFYEYFPT